jgi:hypothetical protein
MNMNTARLHLFFGAILTFALLALCGCSKPKGNVHGKVYYKDKALPNGVVGFIADKKTVGTSPIGEDGSYSMKGIPTGEVTVTVAPGTPLDPKTLKPTPKVDLPKDLADPNKSTEKYTVTEGDQEHDIRLK